MSKTWRLPVWDIGILKFVSDFGFRVSDLRTHCQSPATADRLDVPAGLGGFDHAAKDLDIQARRRARGGLPLHAEREPVVFRPFNRFDDAVERLGADLETLGQPLNRLAVLAVDDDLAFAVEAANQRVGLDHDG